MSSLYSLTGIFSNSEQWIPFHKAPLTQNDVADTQEGIQKRALKQFCKQSFFEKNEMMKLLAHENSALSLDATIRIQSFDKNTLCSASDTDQDEVNVL